jgi:hypothetical protein
MNGFGLCYETRRRTWEIRTINLVLFTGSSTFQVARRLYGVVSQHNIHESNKAAKSCRFILFTFVVTFLFLFHIHSSVTFTSSSWTFSHTISLFAVHHGLEHLVGGWLLATTALGRALNAVAGANAVGDDIFVARQGRRRFAAQALLRRATQRAGRNQANIAAITSKHAALVRFRRDETDAAGFGAHGHATVLTDAQTVAPTDHEKDNAVKVAHIVAAATRVADATRSFIVR